MTNMELYNAVKAIQPDYKVSVTETISDGWNHWSISVYALPTCSCGSNKLMASVHIADTPQHALQDIFKQLEAQNGK